MSESVIKGTPPAVQKHALPDLTEPVVELRTEPCETHVEVQRQGGVVTAIEVRCRCGETTVVEFDYPEQPPAPSAPELPASQD